MFKRLLSRFFKDPYYIGTHHDPSVGRTNANRVLFIPNAELTTEDAKSEAGSAAQKRQRRRMRPQKRQKH